MDVYPSSAPDGPDNDRSVLGHGWASPVGFGPLGEVAGAGGPEKVRQSIRLILGTRRGERVLRPDFGAGLEELQFEPLSTTTAALVRHRVEQALITWEPRIDIGDVTVTLADRATGRLDIEVAYRIRTTNTFYNLVYPFYLSEQAQQ
ncbi:GPW/gp25 family protein [Streptomyces sp. NPDC005195]|uniref:GPW/gp25 family protein n=1 Tax=Streptomyces sp. NPDC005195 TaxID=3154561 RepID=UPI0033A7B493